MPIALSISINQIIRNQFAILESKESAQMFGIMFHGGDIL